MIDYFALALSHALILLAVLRILMRDELDRETAPDEGEVEEAPTARSRRRRRRRNRDA